MTPGHAVPMCMEFVEMSSHEGCTTIQSTGNVRHGVRCSVMCRHSAIGRKTMFVQRQNIKRCVRPPIRSDTIHKINKDLNSKVWNGFIQIGRRSRLSSTSSAQIRRAHFFYRRKSKRPSHERRLLQVMGRRGTSDGNRFVKIVSIARISVEFESSYAVPCTHRVRPNVSAAGVLTEFLLTPFSFSYSCSFPLCFHSSAAARPAGRQRSRSRCQPNICPF